MHKHALPPYIADMLKLSLTKDDLEALKAALRDMVRGVKIAVFISRDEFECFSCEDTVKLTKAIAESSPVIGDRHAIELEVYDIASSRDTARRLGIDRVPSIVLLDGAIKYIGIPAGEELRGFVETIIRISNGDHGLSSETVKEIATISGKAVIDVIVTPPCPYCPYAALLSNMFAYVSKVYGNGNIESRIVEAYENPDIADEYAVTTVPTIAVNSRVVFVGLPYEFQLLRAVKRLAKPL